MLNDIERFFKEAKSIEGVKLKDISVPKFVLLGLTKEAILIQFLNQVNTTLIVSNKRAGDYKEVFYSFEYVSKRDSRKIFKDLGVELPSLLDQHKAVCSIVVLE